MGGGERASGCGVCITFAYIAGAGSEYNMTLFVSVNRELVEDGCARTRTHVPPSFVSLFNSCFSLYW